MPRRLIPILVAGALLAVVPAAIARSLSVRAGRHAISRVFGQETAYASDPVISARLRGCHRSGRRTVMCDSVAILDHHGERVRCTKYFRARRKRGNRIRIAESNAGRHWRRHVTSHCTT